MQVNMDRGELEKIPKTQTFQGLDLLKPLPAQTRLFDNVSSSDSQSSKLSGPFSDVVYTVEVKSKRKAKELYGKDLYSSFSFSPEFKTVIEQIKKEMIRENPNYLKTDRMITVNLDNLEHKPDADFEGEKKNEIVYEFLQFPGIDYKVEVKEEDVEDKKKEKDIGKDKKKKIGFDDEETLSDTMSGYWRMLSVFDKFRISPPWYDAYAEGKEHWLSTKPIPPDVLEMSRQKCMDWLNKYFEK